MTIRSIIIDDEANNRENLRGLLHSCCNGIEVVSEAATVAKGVAAVQQYQPDLLFLDIQLPDGTGFDLLKQLDRTDLEVIFVSAHDQYGIQAVKFSALDYLLKPLSTAELQAAVQKASEKISRKRKNTNLENLLEYLQPRKKENPRIALPLQQETRYVPVHEIVRCEATSNYTHVFLSNKEKVLVSRTLKEFAELLAPYDFIRTHQSHLVNRLAVKSWLREDGGTLLLEDLTKIPVSRPHRENVKKLLDYC
ncbi:LytR/AlgR family response regulator transcription factor [Chitinophaga vietnamensis]|uniref:LytR/AlgR family response regulator transcription factor n=1 Tax=Chitinophaga vietnamensis TaxID=2593957 RepID=UPI0011779581|nr:LytTR family DNA-binding domain-containing protein [Chitinophaga vietnamensis]